MLCLKMYQMEGLCLEWDKFIATIIYSVQTVLLFWGTFKREVQKTFRTV